MESQPQEPEFRKNPKNFHPYSLEVYILVILYCLQKVGDIPILYNY